MFNLPEKIEKKRYYSWGNQKFPSVTTILDLAYQKEWMLAWMAKKMAQEGIGLTEDDYLESVERGRRGPAEHGDDIHGQLHLLGQGKSTSFGPLNEWNDRYHPEFIYTESQIVNKTVGYAGTLDMVAVINGLTYLIDLKTGMFLDSSVKLQLAAYKNAELIRGGDDIIEYEVEMEPVDRCAILWVPRNTPEEWSFREVSVGNREWKAFLSCVDVANYHIANSNIGVLGKEVSYA